MQLQQMKKINFIKRGIQVAITLAIFLVISFSCDMFEPGTEGTDSEEPFPNTSLSDAFPQRKAMLMSSHEISNKQDFPASTIYNLGSGMAGIGIHSVFEPLKEVGSLVWEIWEYKHTESRFDEIDKKLDNMTEQISQVDSLIKEMEARLIEGMDHLSSFISGGKINEHSALIRLHMQSGDPHQFGYWSDTASDYYKDSTNQILKIRMDSLKKDAPAFANRIWDCDDDNSMRIAILNLYSDICPSVGGKNDRALNIYTKTIIEDYKGFVVDTASAMVAYQLLERYFLAVVNYQFQAATIWINAANMKDPDGTMGYASSFWTKDFTPHIAEELKQFRYAVDMLVVNLAEYRNQDRFVQDMQYSEMGIAPDRMFYHVLARSQFVSNLISASIGVPYPKVSGHIFVPTLYLTDSEKSIDLSIGNLIVSSKGVSIESVLPYTTWKKITVDKEEMMQCNPAYTWSVFHFEVPNPEQDWPSSPIELQLVDDPKTTEPWSSTPWVHSKPITGEVTPLYYNPADANNPSVTKTDDCNFQFGYFAGAWQWGDLYLSNSQKNSSWHKITSTEGYYFDFKGFNDDLYKHYLDDAITSVPFAATHSALDPNRLNKFTKEKGISFTHQDNKTGSLVATGKTTTAKQYYMIADGHYAKVKTGTHLPANKGGLKAFATYNVYYGMKGSDGDFITVNIGSKRKKAVEHNVLETFSPHWEEVIMNDDIIGKKWTSQKGKTNHGFGSVKLSNSTEYEPGIQYYYQTVDLNKAVSANISLTTGYQFVYEGYNNLE